MNFINDLRYFDQKLWLAGDGIRTLTIDEKQNIIKTEKILDQQYLVNVMQYADDSSWFLGLLNIDEGIQFLDKNGKIKPLYQTNDPTKTVGNVQNIYQSRDGNLWVAHDNGLAFFHKNFFNAINDNLPSKSAVSIVQISKNQYYASYDNLYQCGLNIM